jgi:hypothetical protein
MDHDATRDEISTWTLLDLVLTTVFTFGEKMILNNVWFLQRLFYNEWMKKSKWELVFFCTFFSFHDHKLRYRLILLNFESIQPWKYNLLCTYIFEHFINLHFLAHLSCRIKWHLLIAHFPSVCLSALLLISHIFDF